MKNRNGFTMIELLAVILILSMIMLVSLPALLSTLKNTDEKDLEQFEKTIFLAAENYFQRNIDSFPQLAYTNGKAAVSVDTLITEGYIRENFYNPNTKAPIDHTASISAIVTADGTLNLKLETTNISYTGYDNKGLIVMYDAITKVQGNRITDLSGNKFDLIIRGTGNSNAWSNSRIKYNGTDNFSNQVISLVNEFTIELVFSNEIDASHATVAGMLSINDWTTAITEYPAMKINYNKTTKVITYQALVPATNAIESREIEIGHVSKDSLKSVNTYTIVKKSGSLEIYLNGTKIETYNDTAFMSRFITPMMRFTVGTWASYYTKMDLFALRIYNKAMNFDEVAVNAELDQKRF